MTVLILYKAMFVFGAGSRLVVFLQILILWYKFVKSLS